MDLRSIITLLQLVLSLLTNSQTANNPETQALVSQAMSIASQALNQPAVPLLGTGGPEEPFISAPTIGSNGGDVAPTISPVNNQPIVYDDTNPPIETCSITASVSGVHMVGNPPGVLNALTTINWQVGGMPTSTQGTLSPLDTSYGIFSTTAWPDQGTGNLKTSYWGYFPGGIHATFGSSTCETYFPDVSPDAFGIPSSTVYSTN